MGTVHSQGLEESPVMLGACCSTTKDNESVSPSMLSKTPRMFHKSSSLKTESDYGFGACCISEQVCCSGLDRTSPRQVQNSESNAHGKPKDSGFAKDRKKVTFVVYLPDKYQKGESTKQQ